MYTIETLEVVVFSRKASVMQQRKRVYSKDIGLVQFKRNGTAILLYCSFIVVFRFSCRVMF